MVVVVVVMVVVMAAVVPYRMRDWRVQALVSGQPPFSHLTARPLRRWVSKPLTTTKTLPSDEELFGRVLHKFK